ncbi:MAG: Ca2+-binding RTX toxin-like protein, partial [Kiritimatiellia bacterium]
MDYELDSLEQRLLLSADPVAHSLPDTPTTSVTSSIEASLPSQDAPENSGDGSGLFDDLSEQDFAVDAAESAATERSDSAAQNADEAVELSPVPEAEALPQDTFTGPEAPDVPSAAEEQVDTLNSANGPPGSDDVSMEPLENTTLTTPSAAQAEVSASTFTVENAAEHPQIPHLPGLALVDSDLENISGQLIYVDTDGAEDLLYDGPIRIEDIDVPAFALPDFLTGLESEILGETLDRLNEQFSAVGVSFTDELPETGSWSTIYLGGDAEAFAAYGTFLGLAEKVDVGNADRSDVAYVFSDNLTAESQDRYVNHLEQTIAHEAGRLLGYANSPSPSAQTLTDFPLYGVAMSTDLLLDLGKSEGPHTVKVNLNVQLLSVTGTSEVSKTTQKTVKGGGEKTLDLTSVTTPLIVTIGKEGKTTLAKESAKTDILLTVEGVRNIVGGTGDDKFVFTSKATLAGWIDGGGGVNTLDYSTFGDAVALDLSLTNGGMTDITNQPLSKATALAGVKVIPQGGVSRIQHVIGGALTPIFSSNRGNVFTGAVVSSELTGGSEVDVLKGKASADTLIGLKGDDQLFGGGGADILKGGLGDDTFIFEDAEHLRAATVTELKGEGKDTLDLGAFTEDLLVEFWPIFSSFPAKGVAVSVQPILPAIIPDLLNSANYVEGIIGSKGLNIYQFQDNWGYFDTADSKKAIVVSISDRPNLSVYGGTLDFSEVTFDLTFQIEANGKVTVDSEQEVENKGRFRFQVSATGIGHIIGGEGNNTYKFIGEDAHLLSLTAGSGTDKGQQNVLDYAGFNANVDANLTSNDVTFNADAPDIRELVSPPTVSASATTTLAGVVTGVTVDPGDAVYVNPPVVEFPLPAGGARADGVAEADSRVAKVEVAAGGGIYAVTPDVEFDAPAGGGGTRAIGHAMLNAEGVVTEVILTEPGSGYGETPPKVTFSGAMPTSGSDNAAVATAVLGWTVTGVAVSDGGYGYVGDPAVTFTGELHKGSATTGTVVLSLGVFNVTIDPGNEGVGYTTPPGVAFTAPPPGGTQATGVATIDRTTGKVAAVIVTDPGSGYLAAPTVTFGPSGRVPVQERWIFELALAAGSLSFGGESFDFSGSHTPEADAQSFKKLLVQSLKRSD